MAQSYNRVKNLSFGVGYIRQFDLISILQINESKCALLSYIITSSLQLCMHYHEIVL